MNIGQFIVDALFVVIGSLLTIAAAVLPVYFVTKLELKKLWNPHYLKQVGVIIKRMDALDAVSDVIGRYMGQNIYRFVEFVGLRYYFDRIVPADYKRHIRENELYLEPGLLYVASD